MSGLDHASFRSPDPRGRLLLSRRGFLGMSLGTAATVALAGCSSGPDWLQPDGEQVQRGESDRASTGAVSAVTLVAGPNILDLGPAGSARTYGYGAVPAPVIRLNAGDTLRATVRNEMPTDSSVHWHGLALRNDMDGVPPITQAPIQPGESFVYEFIAPDPGTHWFHPHVGAQLDHGLYGALVVEDPREPLAYDDEWVVVLDDWLDGVTATPDQVLTELRQGMGDMQGMDGMFMRMGNLLMGTDSALLGGDAGDVYYPHYLINGRPADDPAAFTGKPGDRIRIRLINAGSDTAFRVALGGHQLTVTHSDGFPVNPVEVDTVLIGMGERYDLLITLQDGVFPFVAYAEGKRARAPGFAIVRTGQGSTPPINTGVPELDSDRIALASALTATESVSLSSRSPDREITLNLTGGMADFDWGINGAQFDMNEPLRDAHAVRAGERVRIQIVNQTEMWHPFHLHGHTYQHADGGPRKDTSIILPGQTLAVDFDADNPGQWAAHCHNIYHAEAGMMTVIGYQA